MERDELRHALDKYYRELDSDFDKTLNTMINTLNPSVNIHEYSPNYLFKQDSDPFYYLKIKDLKRDEALDKFKKVVESIPDSNGSRVFKKLNIHIGLIADEFLYNSFKDVANVDYISRHERFDYKNYDFVIFATTWRGIDQSWLGSSSANGPIRRQMIDLAEEYNRRGIPTVFYSKEDPVNYNLFKSLAKHCQYIYTSASEMVRLYKKYTSNENVGVLQFGVNPLIHNPVGTRSDISNEYKDEVLFAGSWLTKYPVRMTETSRLFKSIIKENVPLTIIDRNLELQDPRYQFPEEFIPYLTPPVNHEFLMKLHKIFRWSINMNSVKYSNTMFANRVYELQAFGNILLSNYNTGINNQFPNVRMINAPDDFKVIHNTSDEDLKELQAKSIRTVMKEHTTYHRIMQIAHDIGINLPIIKSNVLVVLEDDTLQDDYDRQLFDNKASVLLDNLTLDMIKEYDFVTFFGKDYLYEEYYLEELYSGFKYTDVNFVSKLNDVSSHVYTEYSNNMYKTMYDTAALNNIEGIHEIKKGYNLDNQEIIEKKLNEEITNVFNKSKELSVIVPIHNNGTYLEEKCFASLKRSSSFDKMEIIFVNDGSTDETTIKIINRILRRHPDIVYYEFETGSGSASRPRNKGARLATTDFITYLDPDNEATGDGFHQMLNLIKEKDVDMVVGNIIKEDSDKRTAGKYTGTIKKYNFGKLFISDPKEYMVRAAMRVQSIQALIVKRSIIIDNDLIMIEGAAGQDTMFFQELVLNCNSIQGIDKFIHVYYAAVSGSVTNTVSKTFFDKYYVLELERIPFLKKYGLLDVYLKERLSFYVRKWYIPRLERVAESDKPDAVRRFLDIIDLYEQFNPKYEIEVQEFLNNVRLEYK
ncbi:glycosyltransferase [Jeotgalicoccus meleagridis]|uniref:Putative glycosyltransferase EpsJ n=1 Tax=Jeotgalicoccus meleagridis TaxID=2759181 RepID=A0A6V7RLG0_9STAP|nr:glycosyltransferase [Jeotgalicoccus meleagridis]CAD2078931.1 putative glycosyltransferase EpsJ [Jeotgalicoccus meleagridis]